MTENVGVNSPFTARYRKIIKTYNPYQKNQYLMEISDNNSERKEFMQDLITDGTYAPGDQLWQYMNLEEGNIPVTRYTKDNSTKLVQPYTVQFKAPIPGFGAEDLKKMDAIHGASLATVEENIFSTTKERDEVNTKLMMEFQHIGTLYNNEDFKSGVREEFLKFGYKMYEDWRKGYLEQPMIKSKTFRASDVTDKLIRSQYYYYTPPGNPYIKTTIPRMNLSPFGSFSDEQVVDGINKLRHSDLSPYISSKIGQTMIRDEGSNTLVYLSGNDTNEGLGFFVTEDSIQGTEKAEYGFIPWNVVGKYISYNHRMAILQEYVSYFDNNLTVENLFKEVQEYEQNFGSAIPQVDRETPVLQRDLFQLGSTFNPSGYLNGALLLRLMSPSVRNHFKAKNSVPAIEFNQAANWIRSVIWSETEMGIVERDMTVEVLNELTYGMTPDEIRGVMYKMQIREVAQIRDEFDELGILFEELGESVSSQFSRLWKNLWKKIEK